MRPRIVIAGVAGLGLAAVLWLALLAPASVLRGGAAGSSSDFLGFGSGAGASSASASGSAAGARYLGIVAPGTEIHFGLSLRMRSAAMGRYATAVQSGRAASLNARQIGARFGISAGTLAGVRAMLSAAGVRIDTAFPQRTELLVSAPAATVTRLLHVRLGRYVNRAGQHFRRPLGTLTVPAPLRGAVAGATLLDTTPLQVYEDVPSDGMTARELTALYDLRPLVAAGLNGAGQTVAVFSEDTFLNSDIALFDRMHGISGAPPIQRVEVSSPVPFQGGDAAGEVDLDTEVIRELAPRAQILNYEVGGGPGGFAPGIDKIVRDGRAKLANFSYGICELYKPGAIQQADNSFRAAAIANVTVFASSGDQGSYECGRLDPTNHQLTVPWPGSSPYVVSVGGTRVNLRQDGTRLDETGWEGILSRSGGGGGLSRLFRRPSWQAGVPGIANQYSTGGRQVPDVAAAAAPSSGYAVIAEGQSIPTGGTSAAAPLWTGSMTLIDELAKRRTGRLLPFLAPLLYQAAARDPSAFYDVRLGGNRFYRTGPGWDYSTGLGTPDFGRLANDLIALARGR